MVVHIHCQFIAWPWATCPKCTVMIVVCMFDAVDFVIDVINSVISDVVAIAKRAMCLGETLDGEGGFTVWGQLMPASDSLARGGLPIGLARGAQLVRDIAQGEAIRWVDVTVDSGDEIIMHRRRMEDQYRQSLGVGSTMVRATLGWRSG